MDKKLKSRVPDGYAPFYLDTKDGISFITFQLEGQIIDIRLVKPQKRGIVNKVALDPDSGVPIENRPSKPRRKINE